MTCFWGKNGGVLRGQWSACTGFNRQILAERVKKRCFLGCFLGRKMGGPEGVDRGDTGSSRQIQAGRGGENGEK